MSMRPAKPVAARLIIVTCLLLAVIWLLYQHFIAIAPAPPPTVTHSGAVVSRTSHI